MNELTDEIHDLVKATDARLTGSRGMMRQLETQKFMNVLSGFPLQYRYAGQLTVDKNTDWDYALLDTRDNRDRLLSAGFLSNGAMPSAYGDMLTTTVFYSSNYPHIQFILKNDMVLFNHVWDNMDIEFYSRFIWKKSELYKGLSPHEVRTSIIMVCDMLYYSTTQVELESELELF